MSASPIARQITSLSQSIPSKRIMITDASQLPDVYSSTPGGTLYSTTPGGSRIIYERAFMMSLRNSPISQTPPRNLPSSLLRGSKDQPPSPPHCIPSPIINTPTIDEQPEEQFAMDI